MILYKLWFGSPHSLLPYRLFCPLFLLRISSTLNVVLPGFLCTVFLVICFHFFRLSFCFLRFPPFPNFKMNHIEHEAVDDMMWAFNMEWKAIKYACLWYLGVRKFKYRKWTSLLGNIERFLSGWTTLSTLRIPAGYSRLACHRALWL